MIGAQAARPSHICEEIEVFIQKSNEETITVMKRVSINFTWAWTIQAQIWVSLHKRNSDKGIRELMPTLREQDTAQPPDISIHIILIMFSGVIYHN